MNTPAQTESTCTPHFSVVVPCYNEQGAIRKTIQELRDCLGDPNTYELIVVNDGSSDGSKEELKNIAIEDTTLVLVHHRANWGYGAALKSGIKFARADLIVITDADSTYPNERIPELVELADEADMVVGSRTADDVSYPLIRRIPKAFLRRYASWLCGQTIPDMNSGMRVFRKSVAERYMNILPNGFSFTTTITIAMLTNNYNVQYIPIGYMARVGKSKIRPIRDTLNFMQLIIRTGMYFAPLRVFMPIGVTLGLAFLVSVGYDWIVRDDLTEKTILLLLASINTAMFALLADMIDKRSSR